MKNRSPRFNLGMKAFVVLSGLILFFLMSPPDWQIFSKTESAANYLTTPFGFELMTVKGIRSSLSAQTGRPQPLSFKSTSLLGKPSLLHFGATWCTLCKAEAPILTPLQDLMGQMDWPYLEIASFDKLNDLLAQDQSVIGKTIQLWDPEAEVASRMGIKTLPQTLLLDGRGHVALWFRGSIDLIRRKQIESKLKALKKLRE